MSIDSCSDHAIVPFMFHKGSDAMMKVRVVTAGKALHPSEIVVAIKTLTGTENLVIEKRSVEDNSIVIGYPIRSEGNKFLIELPNETQSGSWRVWVLSDQIIEPQKIPA